MNRQEFLELLAKHLRRAKYIHGDWAIFKTGSNIEFSYSSCPFRGMGIFYKTGRNDDQFLEASEYFDYHWSARLNKQMIRVWKRVFGQKRIEDFENFSAAPKRRGREWTRN